MFRKTLLATAAVLALARPATALTANEEVAALKQLPWVGTAGIYTLPRSGSKLALPQGDIAVFGAHAQRAYKLLGNPVERSELEAFVVGDTDRDQVQIVIFESYSTGYIGLDDWTQLDPTALLDAIRRGTEAENQQRHQQGISGLHVRGWLQPPTLDRNTATVYWAVTTDEDDMAAINVNAVALRLGRRGYERLTWIGTQGQYQATGNQLDTMLRAHSFAPGSAYGDHVSTDKMAGYGVAALVGTVLGAKAVKVAAGGAAAGGLAALGKLFPALLAAIAGAFYKLVQWLRKLRRKPAPGE
jgi:uncharacterized membrane-anchored protein